jgi:hypothetical protein
VSLTTLLVYGLVAALFVWGWRRNRARSSHKQEMHELRFPTVYEKNLDGSSRHVFVDFREMLLVEQSYDDRSLKTGVYHLRRRDGPTWETRDEERIAEYGMAALLLTSPRDEADARVEDEDWNMVEFPALEVAYQRFIAHYRDDVFFRWTPVSIAVEEDFLSKRR